MTAAFWIWLCATLFFWAMQAYTKKYIYSPLITACCAAFCAINGAWLAVAALAVSIAGDWFMNHQKLHPANFLFAVALFALAHALFILYAARRFAFRPAALAGVFLLGAAYAVYLKRRILAGQPPAMRTALPCYALISLAGLFFALCLDANAAELILYALGVSSILFSDTMIAEADFAKRRRAGRLILPFYFLCHALIACSTAF